VLAAPSIAIACTPNAFSQISENMRPDFPRFVRIDRIPSDQAFKVGRTLVAAAGELRRVREAFSHTDMEPGAKTRVYARCG